jgi:NAD(P)-dependent dehydrogenase (short-subunit alcohol dehydrogenase family)
VTRDDSTTSFAGPTAAEVLEGVDLSGQRAIVTGATSGIGFATAGALASAGADLTIVARDVDAAKRSARAMADLGASGRIDVFALDLADLDSVRAFTEQWSGSLDILVNNAAVMAVPALTLSRQGHELQFATNHLGHFALATGLEGALARSGSARVVSVSSSAHRRAPVVIDDIDFAVREYDPWSAYGQSKTANILFAVAAAPRWADRGITVNAVHPGPVVTNLGRFVGEVNSAPPGQLKSAEQGAATSVFAATRAGSLSGQYLVDEAVASAADHAADPAIADALWRRSEQMLRA